MPSTLTLIILIISVIALVGHGRTKYNGAIMARRMACFFTPDLNLQKIESVKLVYSFLLFLNSTELGQVPFMKLNFAKFNI